MASQSSSTGSDRDQDDSLRAKLSHPFVERLIGTVRREYLDRILFWTTTDLEAKLVDFQHYFNAYRTMLDWKDACPNPVFTDLHQL
jgi:hypothetical protein